MHMVFMRLSYADCQQCISLNDRWKHTLLQWPKLYQKLGGFNYDLVKNNIDHVRREWIAEMDFLSEQNMFSKLSFIANLHFSNIRKIKICCEGDNTAAKFMKLLKQAGDKLEHLELELRGDVVSVYDPIRQVFEHCPNLVCFDYDESRILVTRFSSSIIRGRTMYPYPVLRHLTHLHLQPINVSSRYAMCTNLIKSTPFLIQFSTPARNCPCLSTLTAVCPHLSTVLCASVLGLSTQISCVKRLSLYQEDPFIAPGTLYNNDTTVNECLATVQTRVTRETLSSTIMRSLAVDCLYSKNRALVRMIGDHAWPQLTTLYLSDPNTSCSFTTPLATLVKHCPNLIHLGLSTRRFVNDENLIFIMKNMPWVTRLQLVGPSKLVTTENLVQLVQCHNIKNLSQLRFQDLYQVNDDVLDALSTIRLDTLISLSLEHKLGITNAGVQRLVDGFKGKHQLRRLKINTIRRMHVSSNIVKYARIQLPHTFVIEENRGNLTPYI